MRSGRGVLIYSARQGLRGKHTIYENTFRYKHALFLFHSNWTRHRSWSHTSGTTGHNCFTACRTFRRTLQNKTTEIYTLTSYPTCPKIWTSILLPVDVSKHCCWVANSYRSRFTGGSVKTPSPPHTHTSTSTPSPTPPPTPPHHHPLTQNFIFKKSLDKFGTLFLILLILLFNESIFLPVNVCKIAGWVVNSVDPDQMVHSVVSDLGLYSLLRPVCLNT